MRKAGEILSVFFDEHFGGGALEKAGRYAKLFSSWSLIVEEVDKTRRKRINAVADHSRIVELERYILLIEADHPGWIQILQTRQDELLEVAQKHFPELTIRGIAFRLSRNRTDQEENTNTDITQSEGQTDGRDTETYTAALTKNIQEETYNQNTLQNINDDELKQTLINLERFIVLKEQSYKRQGN
jgi:hypothetical protein